MNTSEPSLGMQRQMGIYLGGMQQVRPAQPVSYEALKAAAQAAMPPEAYAYVAGSAGAERTADENRAALNRWQIVPRMMKDVGSRNLQVELLGSACPYPLLLAPVGVLGIVHDDGELAVARASAKTGVPMILSTVSSHTLEDVAVAQGGGRRWFQLYWGRNPAFTASLLQRAEAAGYSALVVTLDTKLLAWRERDLAHAYLPFLHGDGLANFFSDPVFRSDLKVPPEEDPMSAILQFAQIFSNPAITWADLAFLRAHTSLPILLKGILHPDDARQALDHGVDGLIVSNHGGRQVDGAIGAIDALPPVVEAVGGRVPVLFDSGIRRGSDLVKALALGAQAVLLGRPYVYGLAVRGEAGVHDVIQNLLADFDLTLALSGHAACADLHPGCLTHRPEAATP